MVPHEKGSEEVNSSRLGSQLIHLCAEKTTGVL